MFHRIVCFLNFRYCLPVVLLAMLTGADPIQKEAPPSILFELLALNKDLPTLKKPKYNSPGAIESSADGKLLYIAQQTAKRIDVWSIEAKVVVQRIHLPDEVTGIAVSPDNRELYATCTSERWSAGKTCVVNLESYRVVSVISTGWGSCAPVLHPTGTSLFVCNRFSNDVSVVDPAAQREIKRIKVSREPCCAAITPDGATLVVGNGLPEERSTDSISVVSQVSLIDVTSGVVSKNIRLTRGSNVVQGVAISADGRYAFITHLIGKFGHVVSTVAGGWTTTNDLTVIDLEKKEFVNSVCLDLSTIGMGNPWGVECSADGTMIVVTHAGCRRLSVIEYASFMDTVLARTEAGMDLQKDFTALVKSRRRVGLEQTGSRAVIIVDDNIFTAGYFSNSLVQLEIPNQRDISTWTMNYYPLGEVIPQTAEREGEELFYDANICFQQWRSCHSCHPYGRVDGFNWILGGGAKQYPKNTRGLLHSWWTPPTTWTGRRGAASAAIKAGLDLELFQAPYDENALPLDTFCMNMKAVQSPNLVKGRLSAAAQRGKVLFHGSEVNCAACHSGPLFTDNKGWNTTIDDPYDANATWITPHLREAWRSAPYGHIGSMATVREMIETYMTGYGSRELTAVEIDELAEFVLSL